MSVTIRLADDLDVSRGDMICRPNNQPSVGQDVDAMLCWFGERAQLQPGGKYAIKHTSKWARGAGEGPALPPRRQHAAPRRGRRRRSRSTRSAASRCARPQPLFFDDYRRNRATGSFILVDEATNDTVAAGMILVATLRTVASAGTSACKLSCARRRGARGCGGGVQ